jgi:hypothetical protein
MVQSVTTRGRDRSRSLSVATRLLLTLVPRGQDRDPGEALHRFQAPLGVGEGPPRVLVGGEVVVEDVIQAPL